MNTRGKKVFVGLSGGVDSSVSAALLKRDGYEVTGVFIKAWHPDFLTCTWKDDRRDAMRVCATLNIPFLTFDLEKEYKQEVIDYMISEYAAGRTPNPDVMCNKSIKFGGFLKKALAMGADYVATGHYATRIESSTDDGVVYKLLESKDTNKDQTYFIWTLAQNQLAHILFPVGEYTKPEVRKLAEEFTLPTFAKKDSQGLCFLGKVDLKDFLGHYFDQKPGAVLDESGTVIGRHDGAWFYTLGERHGFSVFTQSPQEKAYYIVAKNVDKNTITVSHREIKTDLLKPISELTMSQVNWTQGKAPESSQTIQARMRYRQDVFNCRVFINENQAHVLLEQPQSIVSTGQSIVFYYNGECLGGGIIEAMTAHGN